MKHLAPAKRYEKRFKEAVLNAEARSLKRGFFFEMSEEVIGNAKQIQNNHLILTLFSEKKAVDSWN